jgi:hypothetical protein
MLWLLLVNILVHDSKHHLIVIVEGQAANWAQLSDMARLARCVSKFVLGKEMSPFAPWEGMSTPNRPQQLNSVPLQISTSELWIRDPPVALGPSTASVPVDQEGSCRGNGVFFGAHPACTSAEHLSSDSIN